MTTERVLPAVASRRRSGRPRRGRPASTRRCGHADRPSGKAKGEPILTTPIRAGMLVGASAAIYAVSLAGVSVLQYQSQAETAARNQPLVDQVAQARAANDALASAITAADARIRALAADYGTVSQDMTAYQAQLDSLSTLVAKVQGSAAALATKITLPSVTMHGAVAGGGGGSRVVTVTTTTASGKP